MKNFRQTYVTVINGIEINERQNEWNGIKNENENFISSSSVEMDVKTF